LEGFRDRTTCGCGLPDLEYTRPFDPPQGGDRVRRKALASILAVAALSISAAPAFADPDFGPGNSSKGPHDAGAKCHPPGQTVDEPGCK
jgi:hypothetical protein